MTLAEKEDDCISKLKIRRGRIESKFIIGLNS